MTIVVPPLRARLGAVVPLTRAGRVRLLALPALAKAAELDPDNARFGYVYAVALDSGVVKARGISMEQAQAERAAAMLAVLGPSAIVSSDLVRARDTALLACAALGVEPVEHAPLTSGFDAAQVDAMIAAQPASSITSTPYRFEKLCTTSGEPSLPNATRNVSITAREQPIAAFLQDLFAAIDVPAPEPELSPVPVESSPPVAATASRSSDPPACSSRQRSTRHSKSRIRWFAAKPSRASTDKAPMGL